MATQNINNSPEATAIASTDDIFISKGGTALQKIDYDKLASAIITQYTVNGLAGSNQTLSAAVNALNSNMPTPSSIQTISKVAGAPLNLLGNQSYFTYGRFFVFHMCIEVSDTIPAGTALFQLPSGTYTGTGNNAVFTAAGGIKTFDVRSDGRVVNGLALSNGDRICTELFGFVS